MKINAGQVALVTGAGGGLGRALSIELARKGCHLALVDINPQALEATRDAINNDQLTISLHSIDITDRQQMEQLARDVITTHNTLNLLINNAGITLQKSFETHSIEDWQRVIDINLWGTLYACHFFLDDLKKATDAHIVNLSSMSAFVGLPDQSSYCVAKAGVQRLSESLFSELYDDNVGVTSVHPGCIKTDMIQATLKESDNLIQARENYELAQRIGVTPEFAATKIITAVERNRRILRIGKDAVAMDLLKRLLPQGILKLMVKIARKSRSSE